MKKAKKAIKNILLFLSTIGYCISLSWKSSKLYTAVRLIGKIITPITGILSAFILKYIIDLLSGNYIVSNKRLSLVFLIVATTLISLLGVVVRKVVSYSEGLHNDILDRYISLGMMDKALNTDLELYDNPTYYDKFMSVKRDSYATTYILWNTLDCLSSFITFMGAFIVLCNSNWLYGIVMIIAAFPSAIASQKYTKIVYQLGLSQIKNERKKEYVYNIASTKPYAQDIRLFGIGDMLKQRYKKLWSVIYYKKKNKIKQRTILTTLLDFLPELVIAFITIDISFKTLQGFATVGDYSLYTGLLTQLWSAIYMLTNSAINIYENKLKIDNVKSLKVIKNKIEDNGTRIINDIKTVEFLNVSFIYPETDRKVLNNISFTIDKNEKLALVGINGSGKTTLIKILLRFYDATEGKVLINGNDIKQYKISSLRNCFSCYFQNTPNYGFTLRENITLASNQEYTDNDIVKALQKSDGGAIIKKAPDGLDTYLTRTFEDNGIELSGGQNQKIALARTFFRDSSAVILDEPSSSLDPEAEHRLFNSLKQLCDGKMTLFTSHRLSNITLADKIIVIENGKIIETGTCKELLDNEFRFAQLYQYQAEKYKV